MAITLRTGPLASIPSEDPQPSRPADLAPEGAHPAIECPSSLMSRHSLSNSLEVEAGGIEPEDIENTRLATSGQTAATIGRPESQSGQREVVTPGSAPSPLPSSGHTGTSAGQISAPTEPPLTDPDLQTIAEAWPRLPAAFRKAVMALFAPAEDKTGGH
jgi:hypothetical protein